MGHLLELKLRRVGKFRECRLTNVGESALTKEILKNHLHNIMVLRWGRT